MSHISIRNLWFEYGDTVILERIQLEIEPHSFVSIAGASGCGKSTLLRLLLGQAEVSRGAILIDGEPLSPEPHADRGVVFQRYSVFPHLSVLDNVVLGLELEQAPFLGRLFGGRRRDALQRAEHFLEAVGLADRRHSYPHELSGGMQQRLAIAQALIKEPRLLLLDEPFGALDPGTRAAMHELVLDLWARTTATIVMVTHDLREAFGLGTRLIVLDRLQNDEVENHRYGASVTYDIALRDRLKQDAPPLLEVSS